MIQYCRWAVFAAIVVGGGVAAAPAATSVLGRWSVEAACEPQGRHIVIGTETIELLDLDSKVMRYQSVLLPQEDGSVEVRVDKFLGPAEAAGDAQPAGDALFFKRDGDKLRIVSAIDHGERHDMPDGAALFACH